MIGWILRVAMMPLRICARQVTAMAGCISYQPQDIIVSAFLFTSSMFGELMLFAVYLDNRQAVDDLLVKELDRTIERRL
jgi:hypothetical protein